MIDKAIVNGESIKNIVGNKETMDERSEQWLRH